MHLSLINGLPLVQIELKCVEVSCRKSMQQIVDYKKDPGNDFIFVVANCDHKDKVTNFRKI